MAKKKVAKKKAARKKAPARKRPTLAERMKASKKELRRAKEKNSREGQRFFKEAVRDVFKRFKRLQKFAWPQYTPGWNDGDECVFHAHVESLAVNDEVGGDSECIYSLEHAHGLLSNREKEEARIVMELAGKGDKWEKERLKSDLEIIRKGNLKEVAEKYEVKKAVVDLLREIDNATYEEMFGEGLVVVSRDGIEVEDYEHD